MRSPRRWHTRNGYHPSPQQRYFEAQKPKKRAKVRLFFGLTKYFIGFFVKKEQLLICAEVVVAIGCSFNKR